MNGQMDKWNFTPFYRTSSPVRAAAQKTDRPKQNKNFPKKSFLKFFFSNLGRLVCQMFAKSVGQSVSQSVGHSMKKNFD